MNKIISPHKPLNCIYMGCQESALRRFVKGGVKYASKRTHLSIF